MKEHPSLQVFSFLNEALNKLTGRITPQLSFNSSAFRTQLVVEPESRCAALLLPRDGLAILPFYQTQADLDVGEQDQAFARCAAILK